MILGVGVVLGAPTTAGAQSKSQVESRYSRDYNSFMTTGEAADGATAAIMDCSGAEIDRQDARLNQAYKMVMMHLNEDRKIALRQSERAWIVQRDARCKKASSSEEGGSLGAVIYSHCVLNETIKRTIWLESYKI